MEINVQKRRWHLFSLVIFSIFILDDIVTLLTGTSKDPRFQIVGIILCVPLAFRHFIGYYYTKELIKTADKISNKEIADQSDYDDMMECCFIAMWLIILERKLERLIYVAILPLGSGLMFLMFLMDSKASLLGKIAFGILFLSSVILGVLFRPYKSNE